MTYNKEIYFANLPDDQIGSAIIDRVNDYYQYLKRSGKLKLWRRSYNAYYAALRTGGMINTVGDQNQFKSMTTNHFRSVLTTILGMISSQRIAYDALATNSDVKSQAQAILGNSLLEYYKDEKDLEDINYNALETSVIMAEGWVFTGWNVTGGKIYDYHPITNAPLREGDLETKFFLPTQVARDFTKRNFRENQWFITIDFVNKWDLMTEHPDYAEQIKDISFEPTSDFESPYFNSKWITENCDDIPVYTLYHMPTQAVPQGRMATVLNDEVTLFSGPIPYRSLPLRRITTSETVSENFGYTLAFDLLPIQQALNMEDSIIMTNQAAFGVQNIVSARGSNISSNSIKGGLNLIEYNPVGNAPPPGPLQLLQTSSETYNHRSTLVGEMQLISGANAVSRGDMSALGKSMSGSAMALIEHMAVRYANSLQKSYLRVLSEQATDIITILKDFAKVPRLAMITGIANRPYMKEFTGDDLDQINRVKVDIGSAMAQTLAGRVDLADKYIQQGWARTPEEYTQVINTGRLDTLTEGPTRINLQIRNENQDLMEGRNAIALITDKHVQHIEAHSSLLDSLDARLDPELVKRVLAHIDQHMELLKTGDAALLTVLKQPVLGQGQPPMPGEPPPEGGGAGETLNAQPPQEEALNEAQLPNMPQPPMAQ